MEPFSSNIKKLLENEKKLSIFQEVTFLAQKKKKKKKKMKENPALKKCLIFRE